MGNNIVDELGRIPMSPYLTATLTRAASYAEQSHHPQVTIEHLMLALTEDPEASIVLKASGIDIVRLSSDLNGYIGGSQDRSASPGTVSISAELKRILEAAAAAASHGRRREINGAIVLAAVVGEGKSASAQMLRAQGLTFEEAIRALQKSQTEATAQGAGQGAAQASAPAQPPPAAPMAAPPSAPSLPPVPSPAKKEKPTTEDFLAGARERIQTKTAPPYQPPSVAPSPAPEPQWAPPPAEPGMAPAPRWVPAPHPVPAEAYVPRTQGTAPPPPPMAPAPPIGMPGGVYAPAPAGPPLQRAPAPAARPAPPWSDGRAVEAEAMRPQGAGAPSPSYPPAARAQPARQAGRHSVQAGQLVENIPRAMRVAVPVLVEARVARSSVRALAEGMQGPGAAHTHSVLVSKAMSVRLRAPEGGFYIETASPETQWIENVAGVLTDDYASWRWSVTPKVRGKRRLQMILSARTVSSDGLTADTALPDQIVEVKVGINYSELAKRWSGWIAAAVSGGLFARFGEDAYGTVRALLDKIISG